MRASRNTRRLLASVDYLRDETHHLLTELYDNRAKLGHTRFKLRERIRRCGVCVDGVIEVERSMFTHGADAYDGAGTAITDEFPCPECGWLRDLLAEIE